MACDTIRGWGAVKTRLSDWNKFWIALGAGFLGLCIAVEIVRAIYNHGWQKTFFATVEYIGQLTWLSEFQTLLTGAAAVLAATLSVRAVKDQIRASDEAVQRQIDHEKALEAKRIEAKRDAARAVLPLTLSSICDYAHTCGKTLHLMLRQNANNIRARKGQVPQFRSVPDEAMRALKEMIEFLERPERLLFANLIGEIQVQSARIRGLQDESRSAGGVPAANIESYIADSLVIYAQASTLFDFARGDTETVPIEASDECVRSAILSFGIYDLGLRSRLYRKLGRNAPSVVAEIPET